MLNNFMRRDCPDDGITRPAFDNERHEVRVGKSELCQFKVVFFAARTFEERAVV